jgi:hypothetical protein
MVRWIGRLLVAAFGFVSATVVFMAVMIVVSNGYPGTLEPKTIACLGTLAALLAGLTAMNIIDHGDYGAAIAEAEDAWKKSDNRFAQLVRTLASGGTVEVVKRDDGEYVRFKNGTTIEETKID